MQTLQNNNKIYLDENNGGIAYDFSKYSNLKDFNIDDDLLEKFKPIAQELNLSQESVEKLLDIAYQMSLKQDEKFKKDLSYKQESLIKNYMQMFEQDKELPDVNSPKLSEYMRLADDAYRKLTSPELKEILKQQGLIYNPELIKLFHTVGEILQEDTISFNGKPLMDDLTPAQILYGKHE